MTPESLGPKDRVTLSPTWNPQKPSLFFLEDGKLRRRFIEQTLQNGFDQPNDQDFNYIIAHDVESARVSFRNAIFKNISLALIVADYNITPHKDSAAKLETGEDFVRYVLSLLHTAPPLVMGSTVNSDTMKHMDIPWLKIPYTFEDIVIAIEILGTRSELRAVLEDKTDDNYRMLSQSLHTELNKKYQKQLSLEEIQLSLEHFHQYYMTKALNLAPDGVNAEEYFLEKFCDLNSPLCKKLSKSGKSHFTVAQDIRETIETSLNTKPLSTMKLALAWKRLAGDL